MNHRLSQDLNQPIQLQTEQREEDIAAIQRGIEDEKAGRVIPFEQFDDRLRAEFEFTSRE